MTNMRSSQNQKYSIFQINKYVFFDIRELRKMTTATSCGTPPNGNFNKQNNETARSKYNLVGEAFQGAFRCPFVACLVRNNCRCRFFARIQMTLFFFFVFLYTFFHKKKNVEKSSSGPRMSPNLTISTYRNFASNFRIRRKKLQERCPPNDVAVKRKDVVLSNSKMDCRCRKLSPLTVGCR